MGSEASFTGVLPRGFALLRDHAIMLSLAAIRSEPFCGSYSGEKVRSLKIKYSKLSSDL